MPQQSKSQPSRARLTKPKLLIAIAPLLLLCSLLPRLAFAQSVTVSGTVIRDENREPGLDRQTIGYSDCIGYGGSGGESIEVPLTLVGTQGYTLQVWSGLSEACADNDARAEQEANGRCWRVWSGDPTNRVALPVRGILPPVTDSTDERAVCEREEEGSLTLYFLVFEGANAVGTETTLAFKYDLKGPTAPTLGRIEEGEGRLFAHWDPLETSDVVGYRMFCEETGGAAGAPSGDAGCSTPTLRAGSRPDESLRRGSTSSTADQVQASGLSDGVSYGCGIAGYDKLENLGKLSNILCGTPGPVLDYFEAYRRAGGRAGGGYCQFGRTRASMIGTGFGILLVALALRRKRGLVPRRPAGRGSRGAQ